MVDDRIVVNDPAISFLLGFTGPSTIAVRKDPPGSQTTEIGTIDINTGAYHQVYSTTHTSLSEMLGADLRADGRCAAFEYQNGLDTDWYVLDMETGQTSSLGLTNGGAVVSWTPSYILFNTGSGLVEVDPTTGARSPVANSADYNRASPNASHLAGAIYRDLGDPDWCMNTVVTGAPGGLETVATAGKNSFYSVLDVANAGDLLMTQGSCGPGPQGAMPAANSVGLWHLGQVIQQFPQSANVGWENAKFVGDASVLAQRDSLTQANTPEGPGLVSTAAELDLVNLCTSSGCQPSSLLISQASGPAAAYLYFVAPAS